MAGQYGFSMSTPFEAVTIKPSLLGDRAGALGATCLPLQYKLELLLKQYGKTSALKTLAFKTPSTANSSKQDPS